MASKLQTKTLKAWESDGWYVINLIATNKNGIPDLLCLKSGEKPTFIEIKEKGDTVKPLQSYTHKLLRSLGFNVIIEKA